jgi:hydrogenase-4 component B
MLLLVLLCLTVAVVPQAVAGLMLGVLDQVLGEDASPLFLDLESSEAPLYLVGNINAWMFLALGTVTLFLLARMPKALRAEGSTWGCGYLRPTARMQYTGRSFTEMIAEHLLPRFLRPRTTQHAPGGLFPSKSDFASEAPDPFGKKIYEPFFCYWADRFSQLRILQQGKVHIYLVYIVLTVVLALAWVSLRRWWGTA